MCTGLALSLNPQYMTIAFYFNKYRGIASGISEAGFSTGILSGSLITQSLIDNYGLKGAFLLIAGISLQVCPLGALLRPTEFETKTTHTSTDPNPTKPTTLDKEEVKPDIKCPATPAEEAGGIYGSIQQDLNITAVVIEACGRQGHAETDGRNRRGTGSAHARTSADSGESENWLKEKVRQKLLALRSLSRNKAFVCHCFNTLFVQGTAAGVALHLQEYVRTLGASPGEAAALFVGVGVLNLVSVLLTGALTTGNRVHPLNVSISLMVIGGVSITLFPLYSATYVGQVVFACLYGLASGGFYALISVLTVELAGLKSLVLALGAEGLCMGIGSLLIPPAAGLCYTMAGLADVMASVFLCRGSDECTTSCGSGADSYQIVDVGDQGQGRL